MKVKELIKMLQELPEEQQELEIRTCYNGGSECVLESPTGLYAQPEYKRLPNGPYGVSYVKTGKIEYITFEVI